jgi:putative thioredoxin
VSYDVNQADFEARVIERSREVPVIVDFWAEWCGPCRTLGPALESAVEKRAGEVELAKLDVDANQSIAAAFGIRGIPAVKAFRDGAVVDEFTGAVPPAEIERFLDRVVPSPADRLAMADDEGSLRRALELQPGHGPASRALARLLLQRGDTDGALELLDGLAGDFEAEGLAARARLAAANGSPADERLRGAFEAWDAGDHAAALEALQGEIADANDPGRRDLLRQAMVGIFTELGPGHPLASEHRRRLAAALN